MNTQKVEYNNRSRRSRQGNWEGSVGEYVEKHGNDINNAASKGKDAFIGYLKDTMMPQLSQEGQDYLNNIITTSYSNIVKIQSALYNAALKGAGLGLNYIK